MHFLKAIKGNAHIGKAHLAQLLGLCGGDKRTVGGNDSAHAPGLGVLCKLHEVLAHHGLAAGKEHDRTAVGSQIVDHGLGLFCGNVVLALQADSLGVAVHAAQVAALGHVPDHNGLLVLGKLQKMRGQLAGLAPVAQNVRFLHLSAVQFGNADHMLLAKAPRDLRSSFVMDFG